MTRAIRKGGRFPLSDGSPYRWKLSATWAAPATPMIAATLPTARIHEDLGMPSSADQIASTTHSPAANIRCVACDATPHHAITQRAKRSVRETVSPAKIRRYMERDSKEARISGIIRLANHATLVNALRNTISTK